MTSESPYELSGVIGESPISSPSGTPQTSGLNSNFKSITVQDTYDTLDEPVSTTLFRDFKAICKKLIYVMLPYNNGDIGILRDWDLWGPLILCLLLAVYVYNWLWFAY